MICFYALALSFGATGIPWNVADDRKVEEMKRWHNAL